MHRIRDCVRIYGSVVTRLPGMKAFESEGLMTVDASVMRTVAVAAAAADDAVADRTPAEVAEEVNASASSWV